MILIWYRGQRIELVGLKPEAIFVTGTPLTAALQRETRTIPIIFAFVSDPIGSGFVASLPHPGGNLTGFSNQDPTLAGKWVELLTEIAPGRTRVAALFNPDTGPSPDRTTCWSQSDPEPSILAF